MKKILLMGVMWCCMFLMMGTKVEAAEHFDFEVSQEQLQILKDMAQLLKDHPEEVKELIAYVKDKYENDELSSAEDIYAAIAEGEAEFHITLSEEERQNLVLIYQKVSDMGLDVGNVLDQTVKVYEKYGDEVFNDSSAAVKEVVAGTVSQTFKQFMTDLKYRIWDYVKGLLN